MYIYIHICTYIYLRAWPRAGPWALGRCMGLGQNENYSFDLWAGIAKDESPSF